MSAIATVPHPPTEDELKGCSLIMYTGESMRYRTGSVLAVLPEVYAGQPLKLNQAYAVETRSQGRVLGRYLGMSPGTAWAPGQPCAIIAPDKVEFTPMEIPLSDIASVARIVACISDEREM